MLVYQRVLVLTWGQNLSKMRIDASKLGGYQNWEGPSWQFKHLAIQTQLWRICQRVHCSFQTLQLLGKVNLDENGSCRTLSKHLQWGSTRCPAASCKWAPSKELPVAFPKTWATPKTSWGEFHDFHAPTCFFGIFPIYFYFPTFLMGFQPMGISIKWGYP